MVRQRDDSILNHKRNIDELERKIGELDRQIQGLELRHQALEKQHEIQLKQQMDKTANLNEILNTEKETRQSWVERFEKEQKQHSETTQELLMARSQVKDRELEVKEYEIKLENLKKTNDLMNSNSLKQQEGLNQQIIKIENLERELNTSQEVLKQVEDQRREFQGKVREEMLTLERNLMRDFSEKSMEFEDVLSRCRDMFTDRNALKNQTHQDKAKIEGLNKLNNELHDKTLTLNKELSRTVWLKESIEMQFDELDTLCPIYFNNHSTLNEEVVTLRGKTGDLTEQLADQATKLEKLARTQQELDMMRRQLFALRDGKARGVDKKI